MKEQAEQQREQENPEQQQQQQQLSTPPIATTTCSSSSSQVDIVMLTSSTTTSGNNNHHNTSRRSPLAPTLSSPTMLALEFVLTSAMTDHDVVAQNQITTTKPPQQQPQSTIGTALLRNDDAAWTNTIIHGGATPPATSTNTTAAAIQNDNQSSSSTNHHDVDSSSRSRLDTDTAAAATICRDNVGVVGGGGGDDDKDEDGILLPVGGDDDDIKTKEAAAAAAQPQQYRIRRRVPTTHSPNPRHVDKDKDTMVQDSNKDAMTMMTAATHVDESQPPQINRDDVVVVGSTAVAAAATKTLNPPAIKKNYQDVSSDEDDEIVCLVLSEKGAVQEQQEQQLLRQLQQQQEQQQELQPEEQKRLLMGVSTKIIYSSKSKVISDQWYPPDNNNKSTSSITPSGLNDTNSHPLVPTTPGAVAVRGMDHRRNHDRRLSSDSYLSDFDELVEEVNQQLANASNNNNNNTPPTRSSATSDNRSSFVLIADIITEDDIRRQYLSEARDEIFGEPVKAEVFDETSIMSMIHSKQRRRNAVILLLVSIAVVVVVVVAVVVVRGRHHSNNNNKNDSSIKDPGISITCDMMTQELNSNLTNTTNLYKLFAAYKQQVDDIVRDNLVNNPNCGAGGKGTNNTNRQQEQQPAEVCFLNINPIARTTTTIKNGTTSSSSLAATAAQIKAMCYQLGGQYVDENFAIACNSSSSSNIINTTTRTTSSFSSFVVNFRNHPACVGTICNASQVEQYMDNSSIAYQLQRYQSIGYNQCHVVFGTYTTSTTTNTASSANVNNYTSNHNISVQQLRYLPSVWGAQCANEYNSNGIGLTTTTEKDDNSTKTVMRMDPQRYYDMTFVPSPSCSRRNDTASCTIYLGFDYDADINQSNFCNQMQGATHLEQDIQYQCESSHLAEGTTTTTFSIQYVDLPICTGATCQLSQVNLYSSTLLQASLVERGYQNCRLVYSKLLSDHQNITFHEDIDAGDADDYTSSNCAAETGVLSSDSRLAVLYETLSKSFVPSASCNVNTTTTITTDFSALATEARQVCTLLGGNYFEENFSVECDSSAISRNGNNSTTDSANTCAFQFLHHFLCLGSSCNASELDSYLEWPLVWQTQNVQQLGGAGNLQNCRVVNEYHQNYSSGNADPPQYLPSVWGEQCALENNAISFDYAISFYSSLLSAILPSCQEHQNGKSINCTFDYSSANTQIEGLCTSRPEGQYFEAGYVITCDSKDKSVKYRFELLHEPHCIGVSCDFVEAYNFVLQLATTNFKSSFETAALRNCEFATIDSYDVPNKTTPSTNQNVTNSSIASNTSSVQMVDECLAQTNDLSFNLDWAQLNSQAYIQTPATCYNNGKYRYCTVDYAINVLQANETCNGLGGKYTEIDFNTSSCVSQNNTVTTNNQYLHDFLCVGVSCDADQTKAYLVGLAVFAVLVNNCSYFTY